MRIPLFFALLLSAFSAAAVAHDYEKGDLQIAHPWARVTISAAQPAAAYFEITNTGEEADRLLSAKADIAEAVEIHETVHDENHVVRMRMIEDGVIVPAEGSVSLETGAYHVMLIGLEEPLKEGASFPMTLVFEKAGEIEVTINVEAKEPEKAEASEPEDHSAHQQHH